VTKGVLYDYVGVYLQKKERQKERKKKWAACGILGGNKKR